MRPSLAHRLSRSLKMALHPPPESDKLIFAPAGSAQNTRADQFTLSTLSRASLHPSSPVPQFHAWFTAAQESHAVAHPETCTLSTASLPSGRVSARMVYLKELDARGGFVVYTNLGTSRKAADLATNPHASLTFWWEALQRQVRVEGVAARLSPEASQAYFDTRVRGSRLGAWASRQSQVLEPRPDAEGEDGRPDDGRAQLEGWVGEVEERFRGEDKIPVPDFWGGLRIVPDRVEFWQGRENRLHDRFVYDKVEGDEHGEDKWTINRLSP
ncbi:pyridoxamine 5'-phosphate oxidase [Colletotrichum navitas]|uniref:pyridoxal 5'-phosphate synthase n=1 Tax=Colletotrichum navitas TaxID=681940 RepID=A0AAD8Q854_9PEZI|nr:pyridoxamine 5'-phosphate oxidase [Colletotrichum navitas]KAK1596354.1 pyridoxamine 5'-phosphate oxidase [Colletotrichum navitas]